MNGKIYFNGEKWMVEFYTNEFQDICEIALLDWFRK